MKADFGTIATLFGLFINSAGLGALASLLGRKETESLVGTLGQAVAKDRRDERPDARYVKIKLRSLRGQLFSAWMFLLHFLNVGILVGMVVVLVIGPNEIFSPVEGELAEALTPAQLAVYWVWFALNVIAYLVKGVSPTVQWWKLVRGAQEWLKNHETRPRRRQG